MAQTYTVADHSGYLHRSSASGFTDVGKPCYAEVYGSLFYYWKSKPQSPDDAPLGCIALQDCEVKEHPSSKLAWTMQSPAMKRCQVFIASSEEDRNAWLEKIEKFDSRRDVVMQTQQYSSDDEEHTVFTRTKREKISLHDFEAIAVIGRGSFGRVYQVRRIGTNEMYALKEMSKDMVERENLTEHIFTEKSILQKITHPFIVTLRYAFQTKDRLFLVLDLLSGGELFFHLGRVGQFSEDRAKFYTAEIALALGYLHSLNIIYRDLKPENAVLDKEGHVCLTDFGLAKANVRDSSACTFCGTSEYLAPEFLLGNTHGKAVDWWSLGILFYEMLFGLPPFYSENTNAMYEAILSAPLEFRPDVLVSDNAKDLLTRLLDRDPETRLHDIAELRAHPLFADIDFEMLYQRKIPPPYVPDADTLNNFDNEFTSQAPDVHVDEYDDEHVDVAGFTFDSERMTHNHFNHSVRSHGASLRHRTAATPLLHPTLGTSLREPHSLLAHTITANSAMGGGSCASTLRRSSSGRAPTFTADRLALETHASLGHSATAIGSAAHDAAQSDVGIDSIHDNVVGLFDEAVSSSDMPNSSSSCSCSPTVASPTSNHSIYSHSGSSSRGFIRLLPQSNYIQCTSMNGSHSANNHSTSTTCSSSPILASSHKYMNAPSSRNRLEMMYSPVRSDAAMSQSSSPVDLTLLGQHMPPHCHYPDHRLQSSHIDSNSSSPTRRVR